MSSLDRSPLAASQALAMLPFINEMIAEGHIVVSDGILVIAEHVCADYRFNWVVPSCRRHGDL